MQRRLITTDPRGTVPHRYVLLLLAAALVGSSVLGSTPREVRAQDRTPLGVDQVIDGEELRRKGIMRLGDLLRFIHGGRRITIDGFSGRLSLNGLGSFHEPGPSIYIDGHPIDVGFLGTPSLNLLGVPVEAIDRVEIVAKPAIIYGTFAGRGAIHIHTRPEVEGLRAEVATAVESEVGDPGPFAYLDEAPNMDTQGPDVRAIVEAGGAAASARLGGTYSRHYLTKPPVLERRLVLQRLSDAPVIEMAAPFVSGAWSGAAISANVIGLGAIGKHYPFLPYAAREISANYRAANASAVVSHEITEKMALRHRITASAIRAEHPVDSGVPFLWEHESLTLNTALGRSLERRVVVLGATGRLDRARSAQESDQFTGSLYAAIAGPMSPTVQYQGGGMLSSDWEQSVLKAYGGVTIQPSSAHRGDIYLSISEELPNEQNVVDMWSRRGVGVPHLPTPETRPEANVAMRATGDVEWSWTPNVQHALSAGMGLRVAAGTHTYRRDIQPVGAGYHTADIAFGYAEGTNGTLWIEYAARLLPGRQRLFVHHEETLGGDGVFHEMWEAVPNSRFGLSVYTAVAPDFEVEAVLTRQSGARWTEFAGVQGISSEVASSTMLDLAIYKRLFAGHVHLRLALRNLLRDDVRLHPMGDAFDLAAKVDLRVEFGTRR